MEEIDESTRNVAEIDFIQWLQYMRKNWKQGEHVAIIGPTGRGKTTLARYLLAIRRYVVVLAVKAHDDTIETFKKPWHDATNTKRIIDPKYKVINYWPPFYTDHKIVYWIKPKNLKYDPEQAEKIYESLNHIFKAGGWCVFLDDLGYVTGILGLAKSVATLFSQGRSNNNSIVSALTQPSSIAQRVPTESWRQVRHIIAFKYANVNDVVKIAEMAGIEKYIAVQLNEQLGQYDFLYYNNGTVVLVRNK